MSRAGSVIPVCAGGEDHLDRHAWGDFDQSLGDNHADLKLKQLRQKIGVVYIFDSTGCHRRSM